MTIETGLDSEGKPKLAMGISEIDRENQDDAIGGLPRGNVVAILSDPKSSGELLLDHLCLTDRPTNYIMNTRNKERVDNNLHMKEEATSILEKEEDYHLDNINYVEVEEVEDTLDKAIEEMEKHDSDDNPNVIVETMTYFEEFVDLNTYLSQVRKLSQVTREKEGLCYLYFVSQGLDNLKRDEKEVINLCDGIIDIYEGGEAMRSEHFLEIPKMRKDDLIGEPLRLSVNKDSISSSNTSRFS